MVCTMGCHIWFPLLPWLLSLDTWLVHMVGAPSQMVGTHCSQGLYTLLTWLVPPVPTISSHGLHGLCPWPPGWYPLFVPIGRVFVPLNLMVCTACFQWLVRLVPIVGPPSSPGLCPLTPGWYSWLVPLDTWFVPIVHMVCTHCLLWIGACTMGWCSASKPFVCQ